MKLYYWLASLAIFFSGTTLATQQSSYSFVEKENSAASYQAYLTSLGTPNIFIQTKCSKNGKSCWPVITNHEGKTLKSFSTKTTISTLVKGRYPNRAYLYLNETYPVGKKTVTRRYVIDDRGHMKRHEGRYSGTLSTAVAQDGKILSLEIEGLYHEETLILNSFEGIDKGQINTNLKGEMAIIALSKGGEVFVSDGSQWIKADAFLGANSDREGVISAYPAGKHIHFSIYKYINSYNKGLIYGTVDLTSESSHSGWLYNSEEENVGFNPFIYHTQEAIIVSAENSTTRERNHFKIPLNASLLELAQAQPTHTKGYEHAKRLNFLAGYGVASLAWKAKSSVEANSEKHADTQYDISDALYHGFWFQGKYGKTQLALTYSKQQAEKKGGNTAKASKLLHALIDIEGLFSPTTSLRLSMEQANINGTATAYTKSNAKLLNSFTEKTDFETKLTEYNILAMKERGWFWGFGYKQYEMPSMLGFSDSSKNIRYVGYESNLTMKKYGLVLGYDELSYAQRYENRLNRFYVDTQFGISYVDLSVSSELKDAIKNNNKKLISPSALSLDLNLDLGYILQNRSKKLGGLGYSVTAGYRLKGNYMFSGQGDDSSNLKMNEVKLEFDRYDLWHGFFASANIVF